ncbi:MAG: cytochrome family protein [Acidobacteria bacterium]|nr:cytochrome family protein [Acidobacteriota bacterium]
MRSRLTLACVSVVVLLAAHPARAQQNPYRLKEPDQKKICLSCHTDFEQTLKKRYVHTAVQAGECSGCHDPHVSSHAKLLSADTTRICATCHQSVIPANAKSVHTVVAEGQCAKCHDPHASDNPAILLGKGSDLCFGCHKEMGDELAKVKFRHSPVEQGCLTCHAAHGSDQSIRLLKDALPGLCLKCHKPDSPAFASRHKGYPVAKASCTSCHDPHGSNQPALLLNSVHPPVRNGTCGACHEGPDSPKPFATKQAGYELCRACHGEMVSATLAKGRLHWPVADKTGCVSCHNPHASRHDKLLKAAGAGLCGRCHADTLKRIAAVPVKHAPVNDGSCIACHQPHSAGGAYLVDQPSMNELCTTCHDYSTHSAHPLGEKAIDPRNKNLRVDCLSCHKGHGTEYKWMLLAATNVELCTQCHTKFAR